jgi:hypothetical protein
LSAAEGFVSTASTVIAKPIGNRPTTLLRRLLTLGARTIRLVLEVRNYPPVNAGMYDTRIAAD